MLGGGLLVQMKKAHLQVIFKSHAALDPPSLQILFHFLYVQITLPSVSAKSSLPCSRLVSLLVQIKKAHHQVSVIV